MLQHGPGGRTITNLWFKFNERTRAIPPNERHPGHTSLSQFPARFQRKFKAVLEQRTAAQRTTAKSTAGGGGGGGGGGGTTITSSGVSDGGGGTTSAATTTSNSIGSSSKVSARVVCGRYGSPVKLLQASLGSLRTRAMPHARRPEPPATIALWRMLRIAPTTAPSGRSAALSAFRRLCHGGIGSDRGRTTTSTSIGMSTIVFVWLLVLFSQVYALPDSAVAGRMHPSTILVLPTT